MLVGEAAGGKLGGEVEGPSGRGSVGSVLEHQADGSLHRAAEVVTRAPQRNGITFALVLLSDKAEADPRGGSDLAEWGCG